MKQCAVWTMAILLVLIAAALPQARSADDEAKAGDEASHGIFLAYRSCSPCNDARPEFDVVGTLDGGKTWRHYPVGDIGACAAPEFVFVKPDGTVVALVETYPGSMLSDGYEGTLHRAEWDAAKKQWVNDTVLDNEQAGGGYMAVPGAPHKAIKLGLKMIKDASGVDKGAMPDADSAQISADCGKTWRALNEKEDKELLAWLRARLSPREAQDGDNEIFENAHKWLDSVVHPQRQEHGMLTLYRMPSKAEQWFAVVNLGDHLGASGDGGKTWRTVGENLSTVGYECSGISGGAFLVLETATGATLVCAAGGECRVSADGGEHWNHAFAYGAVAAGEIKCDNGSEDGEKKQAPSPNAIDLYAVFAPGCEAAVSLIPVGNERR